MKAPGSKLQSPKVQGLKEEAALFTGLLGNSMGLRQAVGIVGWGRGAGEDKMIFEMPAELKICPQLAVHGA